MLLPALGGSALVWNTAMVFYQALLLLGYVYAHFSTRWLGQRQAWLHGALLLSGLIFVPIGVHVTHPELLSQTPVMGVLFTLLAHIGLPFFVVSASAPLLQRWYAGTDQADAANPYTLYAASNAGSMLALVAYPLLLEPTLRLSEQGWAWSVGYGALILLMLGSAFAANKRSAASQGASDPTPAPAWSQRAFWVLWAFIPSSLMLGVTHYMTTDLASVPLLWVIPLFLYLASFVVVFRDFQRASLRMIVGSTTAILFVQIATYATYERDPIYLVLALHLAGFTAVCLAFHRGLYESRPAADHLTDFYIWMSLGGVLGGAFVALASPHLFDTYFEYPLTLALALATLSTLKVFDAEGRLEVGLFALAGMTGLLAVLWLSWDTLDGNFRTLTLGLLALGPFFVHLARPIAAPIAVAIACLLVASPFARSERVIEARGPYGALGVKETQTQVGKFNVLVHGWTHHGAQSLDERLRALPLSYYHPTSPVGQVMEQHKGNTVVVGLGAGVMAAYGSEERPMTFFEIDPVVAGIAQDPKYFTYLRDCGERCEVQIGDGRLLAQNLDDATVQVFVLDAYNSDSIPIHLITLEAFDLYLQKLAPGGLALFHVSNKYIDLASVVANLAAQRKMVAVEQNHWLRESHLYELNVAPSRWVLVAKSPETLAPYLADPRWVTLEPDPDAPVWTDDYANLLWYLRISGVPE